jgi:hypothetical protein
MRMRGGEAGTEEQEDMGDDATSTAIASSASPSPSASVASVVPLELCCVDWTLQMWPTPSKWEGWCQQTGVWGEAGLDGEGEGEERSGDWGFVEKSWKRLSKTLSSNRESSSSRNMGVSKPRHTFTG